VTLRAIALLSGGLDSVVATALWQETGGEIARCLTFDYGQRAAAREREVAARFCRARGLPWQAVDLPWLRDLARRAGSALMPGAAGPARPLPEGTAERPGDAASAAAVWVPARNSVFVAVAATFAEVDGAGAVIAGFNREEAATFPDNSAAFVAAGTAFLQLGTRTGVRVESPTLHLDKRAIGAAARRLGIGPGDVWSCYRGDAEPCGRCESCRRSARAWEAG
jgi:7-cyano-7-deazaguanine synthase